MQHCSCTFRSPKLCMRSRLPEPSHKSCIRYLNICCDVISSDAPFATKGTYIPSHHACTAAVFHRHRLADVKHDPCEAERFRLYRRDSQCFDSSSQLACVSQPCLGCFPSSLGLSHRQILLTLQMDRVSSWAKELAQLPQARVEKDGAQDKSKSI